VKNTLHIGCIYWGFGLQQTQSLAQQENDSTPTALQHTSGTNLPYSQVQELPITIPALLPGSRYYVDASTAPDQHGGQPTAAALGIFVLNFQVQPTQIIYIQATLHQSSWVLMAEAAPLALASKITEAMNLQHCHFLSD